VVAAPDPRWGERPFAFVVVKTDAHVEADALRDHLSSRVARWWIPEMIEFVSEIPKAAVGKFDKKAMPDRAAVIVQLAAAETMS
jgi:acyl-CoA synthetase (AMP-forming)/AMP-acid ligase II